MHSGFQTRILAVVVVVLVAVGGISVAVVNRRIQSELRRDQLQRLLTADHVFVNSVRGRISNLLLRYGAVANEQRIKALSPVSDAATLRFTLEPVRLEQQCDAVLYQSALGHAEVAGPGLPPADVLSELAHAALDQAAEDRNSSQLATVDGRLFWVVGIPVRDVKGLLVGGLAFLDEVDSAYLHTLAELTACEVAYYDGHRVLVASHRDMAAEFGLMDTGGIESQDALETRIGREPFLVRQGRPKGAVGGALRYVLFAPMSEPLGALKQTQRLLVLTSLLGLALGVLAVGVFIRRATGPLRVLGEHAEAVGRGDFSRRSTIVSRDEFGLLGAAFNRMTENLEASRSELEQAMTNLQKTREQLVQREKLSALGEFVAGVTHELNNPLTAIIGYAELLQAAGLPSEQGQDVEAILSGAQRCQRIVRNLLGFARQNKPERRPADLNTMVEDVLAFMAYELRNGNVTVVRQLAPGLPSCRVDTHQIQQVFLNILSNARQALEGFRPDARIEVRTEPADGHVRVRFTDNGPGIPPENRSRIFDPFFTTKPAGRGTGLGLSLSYGIIHEHGGTIVAESAPGQGTTFIIDLPAIAAPATGVSPEALPPLPEREGEGRQVLVVDDEPAIRDLVTTLLTQRGYAVASAADGEEALCWLKERGADLIVCDLRMPGLGGLPFYERLKAKHPSLASRVIFMTGDVMNPTAQELGRIHGRVCLAKPFTGDEFRRALLRVTQLPV